MQAGLDNYIVKSSSQFALMGETIRAALEQKKVEEALSQSQVLNETVIASIQDGVLVTDQNLLNSKIGGHVMVEKPMKHTT